MKCSLLIGIMALTFLSTSYDTHGASEELKSADRYNVVEETPKQYKEINLEITFYTGLVSENTIYGAVDAQGNDLIWSTIAVPRSVDLGTKFEIDLYPNQVFVARDRGSVNHIRIKDDGTYRIDIFCPRKSGETDNQYWSRVNAYGRITTTGRIIIEEE